MYSAEAKACVHRIYNDKVDFEFLFYAALPIVIICLVSIILYVRAAKHLKTLHGEIQLSSLVIMVIYPAIYMFCWLPIVTKNLLAAFAGINPSHTMALVLRENSQLHGFLDAIVYGGGFKNLYSRVKKGWLNCFKRNIQNRDTATTKYQGNETGLVNSVAHEASLRIEEEENAIGSECLLESSGNEELRSSRE